jgi:hypothetical protein
VDGRFNNWSRFNEPDNFRGPSREQDAAGIALTSFPLDIPSWGVQSEWNDVDINNNHYYVVEFGTDDTFKINAGLNDAWFDPVTDGQGFFITVFPDLEVVVLAWFTYDTELPPDGAPVNLGDAGHRWLLAVGTFVDNVAMLDIEIASGGLFDTPTEIERVTDGSIILSFEDCTKGTVEYDITSINQKGIVPIQRVAKDNIVLCEALKAE